MNWQTIFDALYNSLYLLLGLCLLGLLVITPGDAIRQALNNHQLYNVFVIAGGFVLTLLLAIFLYCQRLYTNRSVLKAIPKTWIPVEKGDVNKKVRKMVVASLTRSALIAWEARPRIPEPQEAHAVVSEAGEQNTLATAVDAEMEKKEGDGLIAKPEPQFEGGDAVITIPPRQSQWQNIAHNGWSSPLSPDLANLQYSTVIQELPHLIEARAVSLAPPDPELNTGPPLPDIRAVDILQRPAAMGLREYIGHLTTVGIITPSPRTMEFLASYEYARFSGRPLSEPEFRDLMKLFADLLRTMNGLALDVLASLDIDHPESDMDQDESTTSTPRSRSLASSHSGSNRSESGGTIRSIPSRSVVEGTPSKGREKFSTAPATPRSKKTTITKKCSVGSFAQNKRPYTGLSGSSSSSMRSTSQSSVIRLSKTNGSSETPYILTIPGMRHR